MSVELILVIILVIFLLGGFSGRFGGYGYGYGHGGIGVIGIILIILVVLLLMGGFDPPDETSPSDLERRLPPGSAKRSNTGIDGPRPINFGPRR